MLPSARSALSLLRSPLWAKRLPRRPLFQGAGALAAWPTGKSAGRGAGEGGHTGRPECRGEGEGAGGGMVSGSQAKNVLGASLKPCCFDPLTGFMRDGYCNTGPDDYGQHTVCARVTRDFLDFTKSQGNDLETPHPPGFPGLKPGDQWCLCAARWLQAQQQGHAPPVVLASTHERALEVVPMELLNQYAFEPEEEAFSYQG